MLIRVMYKDGRQDMVKRAQLGELIQRCQIKKFKRFSGWISVVCDSTRAKNNRKIDDYEGRERRKNATVNDIFLDESSDV